MFDYISQLNAFNERCQITGLSPTVRVVYYTLMDMNNRLFWVSSFKTTIRIIADRSGVNKNGVNDALRVLKNEGYIEYIPSKIRGTSSTFSICPLYGTQNGTQAGTQTGTKHGTQNGTKGGTQTGTLKRHIQDKDKQDAFNMFWGAYPKHDAKAVAQKAFNKLNPSKELLDVMLSAIERSKHTEKWQKNNGQFIPNPATWINQKRWEDEGTVTTSPCQLDFDIHQGDCTFGIEGGVDRDSTSGAVG